MRSVFAMQWSQRWLEPIQSPPRRPARPRLRHLRRALQPPAHPPWPRRLVLHRRVGVTQMPSPSINSTPSQSNVDLYPPTRVLPNPAPSAGTPGAATPGQVPPGGVTQGRAPSGGAQKGGANDRNPVGSDVDDCMKLWGPETPVGKQDWARACERNQAGLKKPE